MRKEGKEKAFFGLSTFLSSKEATFRKGLIIARREELKDKDKDSLWYSVLSCLAFVLSCLSNKQDKKQDTVLPSASGIGFYLFYQLQSSGPKLGKTTRQDTKIR